MLPTLGGHVFRKKEAPVEAGETGRFVVQAFASGKGIARPDVYAEGLQELLNAGDAKGWKLVYMGGPGSSGAMMITWDTAPTS